MPQPALEGGVRLNEFWRWAVDKEVIQRARKKPGVIEGVLRDLSSESTDAKKAASQNADHGTVIPSLHDLHQGKIQAAHMSSSSSTGSLKLPPVKGAQAPQPIGGLWRWPGGPPLPADVESAVTAATPSVVPSALSASALSALQAMQATSAISASPPPSGLGVQGLQDRTWKDGGSEVGSRLSGASPLLAVACRGKPQGRSAGAIGPQLS
eukprot:TRINITY_DN33521_c0_g1_i1.p1 TRINITY_DN33521_c0_g1~~TRINITY_DN33521_c0_g1_i1.p1  ORF type:complete len:210 (+),score=35.24 TRINITY_DN33521_c0_g1_i1:175-804(+)